MGEWKFRAFFRVDNVFEHRRGLADRLNEGRPVLRAGPRTVVDCRARCEVLNDAEATTPPDCDGVRRDRAGRRVRLLAPSADGGPGDWAPMPTAAAASATPSSAGGPSTGAGPRLAARDPALEQLESPGGRADSHRQCAATVRRPAAPPAAGRSWRMSRGTPQRQGNPHEDRPLASIARLNDVVLASLKTLRPCRPHRRRSSRRERSLTPRPGCSPMTAGGGSGR